jgi:hypothetical protein
VSDSIDTLDNRGKGKLQSVMERNDLDDFLCNAMLEDRNFEAERGSKIMIMNTAEAVKAEENPDREEIFDYHALPIPHRFFGFDLSIDIMFFDFVSASPDLRGMKTRRPPSSIATNVMLFSRGVANSHERKRYLSSPLHRMRRTWKCGSNCTFTSLLLCGEMKTFNARVLRRWRVIERSDLIVEILDARNPLLFRCKDLESYVQKVCLGPKFSN